MGTVLWTLLVVGIAAVFIVLAFAAAHKFGTPPTTISANDALRIEQKLDTIDNQLSNIEQKVDQLGKSAK